MTVEQHLRMGEQLRPFDTLDAMVERMTFIHNELTSRGVGGRDTEVTSALIIIAREIEALRRAVEPRDGR